MKISYVRVEVRFSSVALKKYIGSGCMLFFAREEPGHGYAGKVWVTRGYNPAPFPFGPD